MRRENRKDDAVSPVIGVMLMLVVTIVIAAVVVMFSTGLTGDTKTTPTAMFEVSGMDTGVAGPYGEELIYLNIRHKGGDAIPLSDLKINLEQVGGMNSGIIQAYTASDSLTNMDTSYAEWSVADLNDVNYYKSAKETLETKQPEIDAALSAAGLNPAVYGNFYADENYRDFMYEYDGLMDYRPLISEMNLAARTVKEIEDKYGGPENMVFDTDGKTLLGGLMGERMTYPVTVLGQTQPTKSTVSTGNIIHIVPVTGHVGDVIPADGTTTVKWTISYIPTNSVIAKGEFEVIAD